MSKPFILTEEKYKELQNVFSTMNIIPVSIQSSERPMIDLLKGLVQSRRNLEGEQKTLKQLRERIDEVQTDIARYQCDQSFYQGALALVYDESLVEAFIQKVEREWSRMMEKKKEEKPVEAVTE